jgi:hypothetical protein
MTLASLLNAFSGLLLYMDGFGAPDDERGHLANRRGGET